MAEPAYPPRAGAVWCPSLSPPARGTPMWAIGQFKALRVSSPGFVRRGRRPPAPHVSAVAVPTPASGDVAVGYGMGGDVPIKITNWLHLRAWLLLAFVVEQLLRTARKSRGTTAR